MSRIDDIRKLMLNEGANGANLSYITEDLLNKHEIEAVDFDPKSANTAPGILKTYTGNHFVANGNAWTWEDTPGSQCGRTVTWKYTRRAGDSYSVSGNCPQGYPWYTINLPSIP